MPLCVCQGIRWQFDPTIEVVPNTGAVYSAFLNADRAGAFSTAFIKSDDHGKTWTDPVHVYGKVSWTDKPSITSSANGKHVYVSFNGPQGGDLYVAVSHNYGKTWAQTKLLRRQAVLLCLRRNRDTRRHRCLLREQCQLHRPPEVCGGADQALHRRLEGSRQNVGKVVVAKVNNGEACVADGCSNDYYTGQASVANDADGNLVFAYEGATQDLGPQTVYTKTSSDGGRTWGNRVSLSKAGENATGPRVDFAGPGQARIWYMQTSNGDDPDAWNVWFRSSSNAGTTWSPAGEAE